MDDTTDMNEKTRMQLNKLMYFTARTSPTKDPRLVQRPEHNANNMHILHQRTCELYKYIDVINKKRADLSKLVRRYKGESEGITYVGVFFLVGIVSAIPLFFCSSVLLIILETLSVIPTLSSNRIPECATVIAIILSLIPAFISIPVHKSKCKKMKNRIDDLQTSLGNDERFMQQFINENKPCFLLIAPRYLYPLATEYLAKLFDERRVQNIGEAYDKLDEQIHRWNMERSMQQIIQSQEKICKELRDISWLIW